MLITALKSKLITPRDSLFDVLVESLQGKKLREKTVLVVSSKVVAVTQGRVKKITSKQDFEKLVKAEADRIFAVKEGAKASSKANPVTLTLKNGIFIPWAGVDRSNIQKGYAVLWPENTQKTAQELLKKLKKKYGLKNAGVIISDSYCAPLRRGVTAVALSCAGIKGVRELKGKKDLYDNKLTVSRQAVADMLASSAHLVMGESDEQTPFAIITDAPVEFTATPSRREDLLMDTKQCLYAPLYEGKFTGGA